MKTDVVENKDGFDVSIDLPGFTKEDGKGEVKDGDRSLPHRPNRPKKRKTKTASTSAKRDTVEPVREAFM